MILPLAESTADTVSMSVSQTEWIVTIGVTIAVLLFDVIVVARKPHEPTMKECAIYLRATSAWRSRSASGWRSTTTSRRRAATSVCSSSPAG